MTCRHLRDTRAGCSLRPDDSDCIGARTSLQGCQLYILPPYESVTAVEPSPYDSHFLSSPGPRPQDPGLRQASYGWKIDEDRGRQQQCLNADWSRLLIAQPSATDHTIRASPSVLMLTGLPISGQLIQHGWFEQRPHHVHSILLHQCCPCDPIRTVLLVPSSSPRPAHSVHFFRRNHSTLLSDTYKTSRYPEHKTYSMRSLPLRRQTSLPHILLYTRLRTHYSVYGRMNVSSCTPGEFPPRYHHSSSPTLGALLHQLYSASSRAQQRPSCSPPATAIFPSS